MGRWGAGEEQEKAGDGLREWENEREEEEQEGEARTAAMAAIVVEV